MIHKIRIFREFHIGHQSPHRHPFTKTAMIGQAYLATEHGGIADIEKTLPVDIR